MSNILAAAGQLATLGSLASLLAGTVAGLVMGTLPGIGPAAGVGLLIPLAYFLPHEDALLFYVSLYQAAEYGGSITAISISVPGAPNSAAVIPDGYAMNRQGAPGAAFAYSLWSVVASSMVSIVAIVLLGGVAAKFALGMSAAAYVMLGVFGLTTVAAVTGNDPLRGLMSCALGVLLGTVGLDPITGISRFTFGVLQLQDGIPLLPLLIGLFAVPQVFGLLFGQHRPLPAASTPRKFRVWLERDRIRPVLPYAALGLALGFLLGLVPGLAGVVAAFVSYNVAKLVSRSPERFGHGAPEGIVAPESANGALMHATLVPAFVVGIPGTPTSAIILGAMVIMGLQPGPIFVSSQPALFYGVFLGLMVAAVLLWTLGTVATTVWARLSMVDRRALGLTILCLCLAGTLSVGGGVFDVAVMIAAGFAAMLLEAWRYSIVALLMGFIVGPVIETNLRRMLILSGGSMRPLITGPFDITMLVLTLGVLVLGFSGLKNRSVPRLTGAQARQPDAVD